MEKNQSNKYLGSVNLSDEDMEAEKMNPQELVDFLNDFFSRMTSPISENKGFVDKFIGDCVMALFSVPEGPDADDALSSVKAAIGMQKQIDSY